MSANTKIEWADMTWNPWRGCEKVSPGCKHCYAERQAKRNPKLLGEWGPGAPRVRGARSYLRLPRKWDALAAEGRFVQCRVCGGREFRRLHSCGRNGELGVCSGADAGCVAPIPERDSTPVRPRVFCLSFGDWLDPAVPVEWLAELLESIRTTPHLDWLLLTKRPELFSRRLAAVFGASRALGDWLWRWCAEREAPANVWMGTSVEDQQRADDRIPALLKIPARVRFLSCEPLLGPVDLARAGGLWSDMHNRIINNRGVEELHWVIVGGESGPMARPMALEWAADLRRQCAAAGVAYFVKQLGSRPYVDNANLWDWPLDEDRVYVAAPPTGAAASSWGVRLRHPKGADWEEWPDCLRVREFPRGGAE